MFSTQQWVVRAISFMQREKQEAYGALEQEVDLKKRVYGQHYKEHAEN